MHPNVEQLLSFFTYDHLPEPLRQVSQPFCDMAHELAAHPATAGGGAELTAALRKLLEAKDCAVRAALITSRT